MAEDKKIKQSKEEKRAFVQVDNLDDDKVKETPEK